MKWRNGLVWSVLASGVIMLAGSGKAVAQPFYAANGFAEHLEVSSGKVRKFPELIAIQPIPPTVDASAIASWPLSCLTYVRKDDETGFHGVSGARAKFAATLYVLNTRDGTVEAFGLGSRKAKSDADGFAGSSFEIPASLFADGFASGDTLAWAVATLRFRGGKKAHGANLGCHTDHDRR